MAFPAPVKTYHTSTYDAINPSQESLSSKGKNVLITGAGSGIGQQIALSFAKASAANIAILGRRTEALEETKQQIQKSYPDVKVHAYSADVTDLTSLSNAFSSFTATIKGPIHTLIANAGAHPGFSPVTGTKSSDLTSALTANVLGTANTLQALTPHTDLQNDTTGYKARVIHVSSGAAHATFPSNGAYSVAKAAAARLIDFYALENPDVFVLNYHPGMVDTPMNRALGSPDMGGYDQVDLPADFAVWAASPEAAFLGSGRFVWAHWDVDELKEVFGKYKSGELKDGMELMSLPFQKNFTLGLLGMV